MTALTLTTGFILYAAIEVLLLLRYRSAVVAKRQRAASLGMGYPHPSPEIRGLSDARRVTRDVRDHQRQVAAETNPDLVRLNAVEQSRFRAAGVFLVAGLAIPGLVAVTNATLGSVASLVLLGSIALVGILLWSRARAS